MVNEIGLMVLIFLFDVMVIENEHVYIDVLNWWNGKWMIDIDAWTLLNDVNEHDLDIDNSLLKFMMN